MANLTLVTCPPPFLNEVLFPEKGGFVDGRLCQQFAAGLSCCLPCPMTDWVYPDSFNTLTAAGNWIATASSICCVFLLLSWAILPVDKTNRHYLSICLTAGVLIMNLGFVVPLAAQPEECFNDITPHSMHSNKVCGVSGALILFGGWAGVMWAFLRSLSLHLQICWQVLVGKNFMWVAQAAGWGVPILGLIFALTFSGVSFRFGPSCHINHDNSIASFWVPLLVFSGLTVIITFVTFGYCIKIYLQSLGDNSASTENSNLPTYSSSVVTLTPRQAYRRIRRVIYLQWRGICIVLIIVADLIVFTILFQKSDASVQDIISNPMKAEEWTLCIIGAKGDKTKCLDEARKLVVDVIAIAVVLFLLALNGVWLLFFLGRFTMASGWMELIKLPFNSTQNKKEFVSVDARYDVNKDPRSYEMLSKETDQVVTPLSPVKYPSNNNNDNEASGRITPDYFGQTARYHAPARSYSSPRPPQVPDSQSSWDPQDSYALPSQYNDMKNVNPLAMNRL